MFSLAPENTDILGWWKEHEKMFPILSHVAKIVLTIPCSSAKSERTFSCAGNFLNLKRNRLGSNKLEELVILKENKKPLLTIKAELPNDYSKISATSFNQIELNEGSSRTICDSTEHEILCNDDNYDTSSDGDENIETINVLE